MSYQIDIYEETDLVKVKYLGNKSLPYRLDLPIPFISLSEREGVVIFGMDRIGEMPWKYAKMVTGLFELVNKHEEPMPEPEVKIAEPASLHQPLEELIVGKWCCEICGKRFEKAIALAGHKRGHKRDHEGVINNERKSNI